MLLDRKSTFTCNSKINPVDLRRKIFQATENYGLPTSSEKRRKILATVASETTLTTENVEEYLYSDLDDELILEKFDPPSASELLEQVQLGLNANATLRLNRAKLYSFRQLARLFHYIKKSGFIYEAYQDNGFWVKIDGPASLFKLTRRYGMSIAKLLPTIVANSRMDR